MWKMLAFKSGNEGMQPKKVLLNQKHLLVNSYLQFSASVNLPLSHLEQSKYSAAHYYKGK